MQTNEIVVAILERKFLWTAPRRWIPLEKKIQIYFGKAGVFFFFLNFKWRSRKSTRPNITISVCGHVNCCSDLEGFIGSVDHSLGFSKFNLRAKYTLSSRRGFFFFNLITTLSKFKNKQIIKTIAAIYFLIWQSSQSKSKQVI